MSLALIFIPEGCAKIAQCFNIGKNQGNGSPVPKVRLKQCAPFQPSLRDWMISALIEARSCERFLLLSKACADAELARLYRGLWASEHGHYRTFIQLAEQIQPADVVARRWEELLDAEAAIIARQEPGPRMHSGMSA